ncbi:hypothetical protein [Paracoccus shanxieyensis]|uniref:Uncharacterized protein n=1 Tax=Paracoccus shanxieyensis TaxID=2675752 RepID=A0A6L6IZN8_9RHOB|nr:hypothetical protein [Paracoccus shanxieyensis]MTH64034.1 hypothetical protein [Paracoccus shanxieyensis]MTH86925.1 hypothetical protein [Paracoccus shanxieyensis]
MGKGNYRQRLTEMGWWGAFFIIVMPLFSVFFYWLHLDYTNEMARFLAQDMATLAATAGTFARIFGGVALAFLLFPICGVVMVFLGREFYQPDLKRS